jgi:guanylate kinase
VTRRGIPFVISGPSGAGKGTLVPALLREVEGLAFSVSATTRPPRAGEVDGIHYHFLARDQFERQLRSEEFLESTDYCGNLYGTLRSDVEARLSAGQDVVFDIEVVGAANIKRHLPEAVLVFILPKSFGELARRIKKRGSETEETLAQRLARARCELDSLPSYDYLIINDSLDRARAQLFAIVESERLRVARLAPDWIHRYLQEEAE